MINHTLKQSTKHNTFTKNQHDIIEGLLISDGYLCDRTNTTASLLLGQKLANIEFVEYTASQIGLKYSIYKLYPKAHWKSKATPEARYRSSANLSLKQYDLRWYNGGKKGVPRDFEVTPLSLLYWYLGDGNLSKRNVIRLSTCSFSSDDLSFLINLLEQKNFICYKSNRNEIYFRAQSCFNFLEYIGKCPVKCYEYKWKADFNKEHRMSEICKKQILFKNSIGITVNDLSEEFGFTTTAIYRLLKLQRAKND